MEQEIQELKQRIYALEKRQELFLLGKEYQIINRDIRLGSTNFKIGFFGTSPIAQPSSSGTTLNMTTVGGTTVTESNGFSGGYVGTTYYTIGDIVKHLKDLGILHQ